MQDAGAAVLSRVLKNVHSSANRFCTVGVDKKLTPLKDLHFLVVKTFKSFFKEILRSILVNIPEKI